MAAASSQGNLDSQSVTGEITYIHSASKAFGELSNLSSAREIVFRGLKYSSSEAIYQSLKWKEETRDKFAIGGIFTKEDFVMPRVNESKPRKLSTAHWKKKNMMGILAKWVSRQPIMFQIEPCISSMSYEAWSTSEDIWFPIFDAKFADPEMLNLLLKTKGLIIEFDRLAKAKTKWGGKIVEGALVGKNVMGRLLTRYRDSKRPKRKREEDQAEEVVKVAKVMTQAQVVSAAFAKAAADGDMIIIDEDDLPEGWDEMDAVAQATYAYSNNWTHAQWQEHLPGLAIEPKAVAFAVPAPAGPVPVAPAVPAAVPAAAPAAVPAAAPAPAVPAPAPAAAAAAAPAAPAAPALFNPDVYSLRLFPPDEPAAGTGSPLVPWQVPASPPYVPTSPQYSPTSPAYEPVTPNASSGNFAAAAASPQGDAGGASSSGGAAATPTPPQDEEAIDCTAISVTYTDFVESDRSGVGAGKAGKGFSREDLEKIRDLCSHLGLTCEMYKVYGKNNDKEVTGHVLVLRGALPTTQQSVALPTTQSVVDELCNKIPPDNIDTMMWSWGACKNKSRWNTNLTEKKVKGDMENPNPELRHSSQFPFSELPEQSLVREELTRWGRLTGVSGLMNMIAEVNYYGITPPGKKKPSRPPGIGWHIDDERKKVVGLSLVHSRKLRLAAHDGVQPAGAVTEIKLSPGDIYIFDTVASGTSYRGLHIRHCASAGRGNRHYLDQLEKALYRKLLAKRTAMAKADKNWQTTAETDHMLSGHARIVQNILC